MATKTFSIGIPVYNEEKNISILLESIKAQNCGDFSLVSIVLYNDGSTDGTENVIKKLTEFDRWFKEKIMFLSARENKGKTCGLNAIFREFSGDYLVLIDSDLILNDKETIKNLLEPMFANNCIGLSNGWYEMPRQNGSLLYRASDFSSKILREIGKKKPMYTASGALMALKRELIKDVVLPEDVIRDDAFLYFLNKSQGYDYFFNCRATAIMPRRFEKIGLRWFLRAQRRSRTKDENFGKILPEKTISEEHDVDLPAKLKSFISVFIVNPLNGIIYIFYKTAAFLINSMCKKTSNILWRK